MAIFRRMVNGEAIWSDGKRTKKVPTREWSRERLRKLRRESQGEQLKFWLERSKALGSADELERKWAEECWSMLDELWEEILKQEKERDIFAGLED